MYHGSSKADSVLTTHSVCLLCIRYVYSELTTTMTCNSLKRLCETLQFILNQVGSILMTHIDLQ